MTNLPPPQLSRRALLRVVATTATGTLLAACTPTRRAMLVRDDGVLTADTRGLPNPRAATTAVVPAADEALTAFLTLSAVLTGVDQLDATVGRVYLAALQASDGVAINTLYTQAGFTQSTVPTMDDLVAAGLFADEALRTRTDQIIEMWYTGKTTDDAGNPVVVTYTEALAWQVLTFTKATTLCGSPNFWAEPPDEAVW